MPEEYAEFDMDAILADDTTDEQEEKVPVRYVFVFWDGGGRGDSGGGGSGGCTATSSNATFIMRLTVQSVWCCG